MDPKELAERLTRIQTRWTLVFRAHQGEGDATTAAQRELLLRYYGAVYRYLLGTLRDPDAAEELTQDFALRFLRGDFRGADPQRGRFRDFVKTAVRRLAIDWHRKQKHREKRPLALPDAGGAVVAENLDDARSDQEFRNGWREELLARTWQALAEAGGQAGAPYYAVLRCKTERPQMRSARLAELLSAELGRPLTEAGIRQTLHRARQRFADLLVEEVARSLQTEDAGELEAELVELGLLNHCRSALRRRRPPA
jgi:RNA polymerase sigma-70 factor (ECF subfamily)